MYEILLLILLIVLFVILYRVILPKTGFPV